MAFQLPISPHAGMKNGCLWSVLDHWMIHYAQPCTSRSMWYKYFIAFTAPSSLPTLRQGCSPPGGFSAPPRKGWQPLMNYLTRSGWGPGAGAELAAVLLMIQCWLMVWSWSLGTYCFTAQILSGSNEHLLRGLGFHWLSDFIRARRSG